MTTGVMFNTLGPYDLGPDGSDGGIYEGDSFELAERIPDNSVDLIICDPVWNRTEDYLRLWSLAERILRPGASVIAQTGPPNLAEILLATDTTLTPVTTIAETFAIALNLHFITRTRQGWKPWLWFSKGERDRTSFIADRFGSKRSSNFTFHKWGDNPEFALYYIERLTTVDMIVVDPFCGGGTIPVVCKTLGRRYWAADIDPESVLITRERVARMPTPLVVPTHAQLGFNL